jgi:hypothetical protein
MGDLRAYTESDVFSVAYVPTIVRAVLESGTILEVSWWLSLEVCYTCK